MNALVIYDTTFGNTQQIAQVIAHVLGEQGFVRLSPVEEVSTSELKGIHVLVLGCPTQSYGLTPGTRNFFENIPHGTLQGLMAEAFDTRYHIAESLSGSAAWAIADQLQEAGASLLVPPESFFVASREGPLEDGEIERATCWAHTLLEQFAAGRYVNREAAGEG
jgi:flavodoxin